MVSIGSFLIVAAAEHDVAQQLVGFREGILDCEGFGHQLMGRVQFAPIEQQCPQPLQQLGKGNGTRHGAQVGFASQIAGGLAGFGGNGLAGAIGLNHGGGSFNAPEGWAHGQPATIVLFSASQVTNFQQQVARHQLNFGHAIETTRQVMPLGILAVGRQQIRHQGSQVIQHLRTVGLDLLGLGVILKRLIPTADRVAN